MIKQCPICLSRRYRLLSRYLPDYSLNSGERFFKCLNCGVLSLYPFPGKKKILFLYRSGEYQNRYQQQKIDWIGGSKKLALYLKRRLIELEKLLKGKGRLLDVGAGSGVFLAEAKKRGWQTRGVEIDPRAVSYARRQFGISLFNDELMKLKIPGQFFDAVHLNHVLEHVYNPAELLVKIKSILKPGGYLIIEVPNEVYPLSELIQFYLSYKTHCRCLAEKILFRKMTLVKLPPSLHLFFFDCHSLKRLLKQTGFKIIEINAPRRNEAADKTIYRSAWMTKLIYSLEKRLRLGPNLEVFASG